MVEHVLSWCDLDVNHCSGNDAEWSIDWTINYMTFVSYSSVSWEETTVLEITLNEALTEQ